MDRRRFIRLAGLGTVSIVAVNCAANDVADQRSLARPDLIEALGAERVRAIGARYRATHAAEQRAGALRDAILASRRAGARAVGSGDSLVAESIPDDFASGRTVVVDGWILSVTEARQCALFSLLGS